MKPNELKAIGVLVVWLQAAGGLWSAANSGLAYAGIYESPFPETFCAPMSPVAANSPAGGGSRAERPTLVVQTGHTVGAAVQSIAVSPNDRFALTAAQDGFAILWDTSNGNQLRKLKGHLGYLKAAAISPDGRLAFTGSDDGTARIWRLNNGQEILRWTDSFSVTDVAFSPDGDTIAAATRSGVVCLWELETGAPQRGWQISGSLTSIDFSPDGTWLVGATDADRNSRTIYVWNVRNGRRWRTIDEFAASVRFMSDGDALLAGGPDKFARIWDIDARRVVCELRGHLEPVTAVVPLPHSDVVATASRDGTVRVWDSKNCNQISRLGKEGGPEFHSIEATLDGRIIAGNGRGETMVWGSGLHRGDPRSGVLQATLRGRVQWIRALGLTADGRHLLAGSGDGEVHMWDLEAGTRVAAYRLHGGAVNSIEVAKDQEFVVTTGDDGEARLWARRTGEEVRVFSISELNPAWSAAFSHSGSLVATGHSDGAVVVWNRGTGELVKHFPESQPTRVDGVYSVTFLDGDQSLLISSRSKTELVNLDGSAGFTIGYRTSKPVTSGRVQGSSFYWNTSPATLGATSTTILRGSAEVLQVLSWPQRSDAAREGSHPSVFVGDLSGHRAPVVSTAVSPDGTMLASGSEDRMVLLWSAKTGRRLAQLDHDDWVMALQFLSNDVLATGSDDGAVHLWDVENRESPRELARLLSFTDGSWAITTLDGRFHTSDPERMDGLHWVFPDAPFETLRPEVFMRDFFDPSLLERQLQGKSPPLPRTLASLNRVQPVVQITSVSEDNKRLGTYRVEVLVRSVQRQPTDLDHSASWTSGVYDLRLYRNGRLVAQEPAVRHAQQPSADADRALREWRTDHRILQGPGEKTVVFQGVRVPRGARGQSLEFSAYAFNADRVKSITARKQLTLPVDLEPPQRRAYIVAVGVSSYSDPSWDLQFADDDARALVEILGQRLRQSGWFHEVWAVQLVSDWEYRSGERILTVNDATKSKIREAVGAIDAGPDDLVVVAMSSHGVRDAAGEFFLFPHDIGSTVDDGMSKGRMARAISSNELSTWLQDVDSGETILIVDACHSAATVESGGFRPGPMGARGLGQLAYDKGIRILTSSRASDLAIESNQVRQGLMSYALVQEALREGRADRSPNDGRISIQEWLNFPVRRVPEIYRNVLNGSFGRSVSLDTFEPTRGVLPVDVQQVGRVQPQSPVLFDYRKGSDVPFVTAP